jgi:hypothetical protein
MTVISDYLKKIEKALAAGNATEHTHRPALKSLIDSLENNIEATNEPKRVRCGAPDFIITRGETPIGYIEAKDVGKALDAVEREDQMKRYRAHAQTVRYTEPGQGSAQGRVWINKTQYFEGVSPEIWNFHIGGYQVCRKWLKDRKGRTLSYDDQTHYRRVVASLAGTIRLMAAVDETIIDHGGWPIA